MRLTEPLDELLVVVVVENNKLGVADLLTGELLPLAINMSLFGVDPMLAENDGEDVDELVDNADNDDDDDVGVEVIVEVEVEIDADADADDNLVDSSRVI